MIGVFQNNTPPTVPMDAFSLLVPILLALVSTAYIALSKMLGTHHFCLQSERSLSKTCLDSLVNILDQQRKKIAISLHNYNVKLNYISHSLSMRSQNN